ncbi:MAG: trehalose-6-phosphate synthase, partial [Burkholderiales bacterium]|nr:trehalose-6-phosphate synthase [Burkholderiales bacterium]
MTTIRLQLRFIVPLVLTLVAAAYLALPVMDRLTLRWFSRDLQMRATLVANTLSDSIADAVANGQTDRLQALFNRVVQDERLLAIALCDPRGKMIQRSVGMPGSMSCPEAARTAQQTDPVLKLPAGSVLVSWEPVNGDQGLIGHLVLLHDLSFIERRSQDTRQYLVILIAGLGGVIALITVVVAQLSWRGWVSGARALLRGEGLVRPLVGAAPELAPLADELRARLRDL